MLVKSCYNLKDFVIASTDFLLNILFTVENMKEPIGTLVF